MIELLTGYNNIYIGLFGIVYAAVGLAICIWVILPQALKEASEHDGIWKLRLALTFLIITIVASFGMALITTLPPIFNGNFGSERVNFSRFYYGVGVGTVGILLLIIYKYGGELER